MGLGIAIQTVGHCRSLISGSRPRDLGLRPTLL